MAGWPASYGSLNQKERESATATTPWCRPNLNQIENKTMKRILLFVLTNVLILTMLLLVVSLFGLDRFITSAGLNIPMLLIFAAVFGFGGAFISLAISRWMAKFAMGVRVLDPNNPGSPEGRWLVETTHALSRQAGLKAMPEVGVYDSPEVNAFATGPSQSKSLVAVSSGMFQAMTRDEIEGVLAHEVAHIKNGDMVTMTLLQGVINTFVIFLSRVVAFAVSRFVREELSWLAYIVVSIVLQIALSILGTIVVMAYSRHREYHADAGAAALAGKHKMIAALERLRQNSQRVDDHQPALATMKISGHPNGILALFSSHPPLEERIARLRDAA